MESLTYYLACGLLDGIPESEHETLTKLYNIGSDWASSVQSEHSIIKDSSIRATLLIAPLLRRIYDVIRSERTNPEYFQFILTVVELKIPDYVNKINSCRPLLDLMKLALPNIDHEANFCSLLSQDISHEILRDCPIFYTIPTTHIVHNPPYKEWISIKKTHK